MQDQEHLTSGIRLGPSKWSSTNLQIKRDTVRQRGAGVVLSSRGWERIPSVIATVRLVAGVSWKCKTTKAHVREGYINGGALN